jgi:hypothetical protein
MEKINMPQYKWGGIKCKTKGCNHNARGNGLCASCLHKQWSQSEKGKQYYRDYFKKNRQKKKESVLNG